MFVLISFYPPELILFPSCVGPSVPTRNLFRPLLLICKGCLIFLARLALAQFIAFDRARIMGQPVNYLAIVMSGTSCCHAVDPLPKSTGRILEAEFEK